MSKRKMVWEVNSIVCRRRGHQLIFSTPEQIADGMQEWFDYEAADGYHLLSNII